MRQLQVLYWVTRMILSIKFRSLAIVVICCDPQMLAVTFHIACLGSRTITPQLQTAKCFEYGNGMRSLRGLSPA